MKQYIYLDQDFITYRQWNSQKLPRSFELTLPLIGGIAWSLPERESTIDTVETTGNLVGIVDQMQMDKYFPQESPNTDDMQTFLEESEEKKWIYKTKGLDMDYYVYLLLEKPDTACVNQGRYISCLLKPHLCHDLPPVLGNKFLANVTIKGIPYVHNSGKIMTYGSFTNLMRIKEMSFE